MAQQRGFFDVDGRLQELSAKGDALERLAEARARVKIGLANLAYNLRRYVWLDSRSASV